jgi:hypothetical protein
MKDRVNAIDELDGGRRSGGASDPNSEVWQQVAAFRNKGLSPEELQAQAKANYDKIHNKNVNHTIGNQQFNQTYSEKVETMKQAPKLDAPVVSFDFGKKLAEKVESSLDKVEDAVGSVASKVQTGVTHAVQTLGTKVHEGLEAAGLVTDETPEKQPDKAPEKVVTKDQTVNREEAVDQQTKATTGGVAQTVFQNDGDDKVSIKEQDKSFEGKSAYTSSFGDNAGAKGNVTATTGAESGYSGGEEQPNKGQK